MADKSEVSCNGQAFLASLRRLFAFLKVNDRY